MSAKRVDPFGEQDISQQLDSWAAAVEMAVATLNQTLIEVRAFQKQKGDGHDGSAEPAGDSDDGHGRGDGGR